MQTHAAFEVGLSFDQGPGVYSGWTDVDGQVRLCHTRIIDVMKSLFHRENMFLRLPVGFTTCFEIYVSYLLNSCQINRKKQSVSVIDMFHKQLVEQNMVTTLGKKLIMFVELTH